MRKCVLIATAAASLFTSPVFAGTAAKSDDKVPAKLRTSITKQCDEALREYLVAPMEAKIIYSGANKTSTGTYAVHICYQARTGGGGYSKAGGNCEFGQKGSMISSSMRDSETSTELNCITAKYYSDKH